MESVVENVKEVEMEGSGKLTNITEDMLSKEKPQPQPQPQAPTRRMPHLHKLEKKHSSGDLHSRLKTRKLLGVGETDDGDVHRSKLSQILGHSDQLYIKLPPGLRIWQVLLAVIFSFCALWAFVFPSHLVSVTFDIDDQSQSNLRLPVRLFGIALICLSIIYWYTINSVDRDIIRLILMCSFIFFALQSIVIFLTLLSSGALTFRWLMSLAGQGLCSCICLVFYWAVSGRISSIKRCTSNKDLRDIGKDNNKEQKEHAQ